MRDDKDEADDKRVVTTTVAKLKAFEAAVRAREAARYRAAIARDAVDAAKAHLDRMNQEETNTQEAVIAVTRTLHEGTGTPR